MVKVKPLNPKDVPQMIKWGKHGDIRLLHYNFNYSSFYDCQRWYRSKNKFLRKYIFGIYTEDILVGYITLKNINWLFRKGEMGIVMDPLKINQGYGTKAIKEYLEIVFTQYKMKKVVLRVAAFNKRARRAYEKVGFKIYKESYEVYEEQEFLLENKNYTLFDEMIFKKDEVYTKYYYMVYNKTNDIEEIL
jgi:RimJ/RimL family protein N-acetyltransferase